MNTPRELRVLLHDRDIGVLRYDAESVTFRFNDDYFDDPNRRVLGQFFEDNPDSHHKVRSEVPPWFANLLPEGPLRQMIARRVGVHERGSFFILGHLGDDLPGDVRVRPASTETLVDPPENEMSALEIPINTGDGDLKFSLAGVQLKFSVFREGRGLTIPVAGRDGNYIVKLPDSRFDGVPENEYSMMTWASNVGISVPSFELVETGSIGNLPIEVAATKGKSFLIHRFDRVDGTRLHIEDFAQILNRFPTFQGKYGGANYETVGRILNSLGGEKDVAELVRRLVANVAMGNGDAHLKNWSLIYPDGRNGVLSPAYDLVSTMSYVRSAETLALNLAGTKRFEDIHLESFRRMSRKIGLDNEFRLDDVVLETVGRLQDSWRDLRRSLPIGDHAKQAIEDRLKSLPLLQL